MQPQDLANALIRPRRRKGEHARVQSAYAWRGETIGLRWIGSENAPRKALLVHGWEAASGDLDDIANYLATRGYRSLLPDLPAHGTSTGETLMIPEGADLLCDLDGAYGPFDLAIGHSIGSAMVLLAQTQGLRSRAIALLTPPENYRRQLSLAARLAGASEEQIEAALGELRRRYAALDELDGPSMAKLVDVPMLVVAAGRDRLLDPENGRRLVAAASRAFLLELPDATHRSILSDAALPTGLDRLIGQT